MLSVNGFIFADDAWFYSLVLISPSFVCNKLTQSVFKEEISLMRKVALQRFETGCYNQNSYVQPAAYKLKMVSLRRRKHNTRSLP